MNTASNDITGDRLQTKPSSERYRNGWEKVYGKRRGATGVRGKCEAGEQADEDTRARRDDVAPPCKESFTEKSFLG